MSSALPLRRRLLFALVPVTALLLLAELALRAARAPLHFGSFRVLRTDLFRRNYPAELHPTLGYVPRANFASADNHWETMVSIDSMGLRRNGQTPPPADQGVVLAVGDSFTFGDQVNDDESWPALLERELGRRVCNGGVFGYSFTQSALRAELLMDSLPVDTLIFSFIPDDLRRSEYCKRYTFVPWFDIVDGRLELRGVPIAPDALAHDAGKAWKDLIGHSALLDAIFTMWDREWWFESEKQVAVPHLAGRGKEIAMLLLDRLQALCGPRQVHLLLLLQDKQPTADALEVLAHASRKDIQTLDLASRYAALVAAQPAIAGQWFDGHMTPEGNAWVARELAAALPARRNRTTMRRRPGQKGRKSGHS